MSNGDNEHNRLPTTKGEQVHANCFHDAILQLLLKACSSIMAFLKSPAHQLPHYGAPRDLGVSH